MIIGMIVDHYDGTLSPDGERLLARLIAGDASVRAMYDDYGASLGLSVPPPEVDDAEALRRGVVMAVAASRARARRRRVLSVVSVAAVVATLFAVLSGGDDSVQSAPVVAANIVNTPSEESSSDAARSVEHIEADKEVSGEPVLRTRHVREVVAHKPQKASPSEREGEVAAMLVEGREEFFLATPLEMITLEHDPADMLGSISSLPGIYAGYSRYAPGKGFQVRLTEIVQNIKTIAL